MNAAWRYYNLADFVITMQDPKTAATLRIGCEDAATYLGGMMVDPMWAAGAYAKPAKPDEGKAAVVLGTMSEALQKDMEPQ